MSDDAVLALVGKPKLSLEFQGLPSLNTYFNMHYRKRGVCTAEWRYEAKSRAIDEMGFFTDYPLIKQRALVVVNVFPPYEEVSDIHNIVIKPLLDGFTSAGVWQDDEWATVPLVLYRWAGIGKQKPRQHKIRRTVIDVYELEDMLIMGKAQKLPKGRKRLRT